MSLEDSNPIFYEWAEDALRASGEISPEQQQAWLGWLAAKERFESRDEDSDPEGAAVEFFSQAPPDPATPEQAANWLGWLASKEEFESGELTAPSAVSATSGGKGGLSPLFWAAVGAVVVAGGIGVSPVLSLLAHLCDVSSGTAARAGQVQ